MHLQSNLLCAAFEGTRLIASGELAVVIPKVKEVLDRGPAAPVLLFDDASSELIEVDLRGSTEDVLARVPAGPEDEPRRPGRPKLGVVAREVTLLPRHWEWLGSQPGGASVALRKLVEEARRANEAKDRQRVARESAYRFMAAVAGNLPGYEESLRALFAGDQKRFEQLTEPWPEGLRSHARKLAGRSFSAG
jgi:hypothetical protein